MPVMKGILVEMCVAYYPQRFQVWRDTSECSLSQSFGGELNDALSPFLSNSTSLTRTTSDFSASLVDAAMCHGLYHSGFASRRRSSCWCFIYKLVKVVESHLRFRP